MFNNQRKGRAMIRFTVQEIHEIDFDTDNIDEALRMFIAHDMAKDTRQEKNENILSRRVKEIRLANKERTYTEIVFGCPFGKFGQSIAGA